MFKSTGEEDMQPLHNTSVGRVVPRKESPDHASAPLHDNQPEGCRDPFLPGFLEKRNVLVGRGLPGLESIWNPRICGQKGGGVGQMQCGERVHYYSELCCVQQCAVRHFFATVCDVVPVQDRCTPFRKLLSRAVNSPYVVDVSLNLSLCSRTCPSPPNPRELLF